MYSSPTSRNKDPPDATIRSISMAPRAKNDFEKNLYKLMNNAVFGKIMENVRNHVDVKLLTKWDGRYGAEVIIAKPNFHSRSVFAENGKKDTKKVKGVKSNVVARTTTFDDYRHCLNKKIEITRRQSCIRSNLHEVYTISESKIALSPYDDKRYVVPDSTETVP
ncbi:hypothetical protein ALC57_12180 [Trachymyrmex cornetzi]|uniref:DNA-directed DNA polymerase n=1 Tax=Trachymyrmex cornetzi TaxID=471704 RepID=A0A151J1F5_9HYME|nr:hypothetical protein ALC57_12180 [Trachymyrmex cornetzi]